MSKTILFNKFPYTDFHEMNLDWLLEVVTKLYDDMETFVNINTIKYADPLLWNITSQYEQNTLVQDADGNTYLSKQPVTSGINLDNTDFWLKVADFSILKEVIKKSITAVDEGTNPTATDERNINDLLWRSDRLYIITSHMNIGEAYIDGVNCRQVTVAELINHIIADLDKLIEDVNTYHKDDIRRYGAKCDGITDDTAAVVACIEANHSAYFPSGTTVISTITLPDEELMLYGCGEFSKIKCASDEMTMFIINTIKHITIKDLYLDISYKSLGIDYKTVDPLFKDSYHLFNFDNITFYIGIEAKAINLKGTWNSFISKCTFSGLSDTEHEGFGSDNSAINIEYYTEAGLPGHAENITITECRFDNLSYCVTGSAPEDTIDIGAIQIYDCMILRCSHTIEFNNMEQLTIVGNILDNIGIGPILNDVTVALISNNRISVSAPNQSCIKIEGEHNLRGITISNNTLINFSTEEVSPINRYGITIFTDAKITGLVIEGNQFYKHGIGINCNAPTPSASQLTGFIINGNSFFETLYPISVYACKDCLITNNNFADTTDRPITVGTVAKTKVVTKDNICKGYSQTFDFAVGIDGTGTITLPLEDVCPYGDLKNFNSYPASNNSYAKIRGVVLNPNTNILTVNYDHLDAWGTIAIHIERNMMYTS